MISNGSSFLFVLFLKTMLTVLLEENVRPLSTAYASSLFVTPCRALATTLWFLVEVYITWSSEKSDASTSFPNSPNIQLIVTRKRVTLSTSPCGIPKFVCFVRQILPLSLSSTFNQSILKWISTLFSVFLYSLVVLLTCHRLSRCRRRLLWFSSSSCICWEFFCYFWHCVYCTPLFSEAKLSVIYFFSFSRYQTSLLNILQSIFVPSYWFVAPNIFWVFSLLQQGGYYGVFPSFWDFSLFPNLIMYI